MKHNLRLQIHKYGWCRGMCFEEIWQMVIGPHSISDILEPFTALQYEEDIQKSGASSNNVMLSIFLPFNQPLVLVTLL